MKTSIFDPSSPCGIAVMAKASAPGRTKTRLVPPLTFEEAAALNTVFLKDAFANIAEASRVTPIRGLSRPMGPSARKRFFENARRDTAGSDPGRLPEFRRMPFRRHRGHVRGRLLLGLRAQFRHAGSADRISRALARELAGGRDRVVIGPADDGGYYILGISRPHRRLFAEIDWSTERVYRPDARTRGGARPRGRQLADVERYRRRATLRRFASRGDAAELQRARATLRGAP